MSASITTNSSPPWRLTVSTPRTQRVRRAATSLSTSVARLVAVGVVDRLEAVEVEEHHGDLGVLAPRGGQRLVQAVEEQHAVRQPGQQVVLGQVAGLLLGLLAVGDVGQDRHVAGDARRRVADRGQRHPHRIHLAVARARRNLAFPVIVVGDAVPDLLVERRLVQAGAQSGHFSGRPLGRPEAGDVGVGLVDRDHAEPLSRIGLASRLFSNTWAARSGCARPTCAADVAHHRVRQELMVQRHRGQQHLGPERLPRRILV